MATYNKKRPERRPTHPGAILKRMWLDELGYTQSGFADALVAASPNKIKKSTMQTKLNELINGKRAMSADFAVLIGKRSFDRYHCHTILKSRFESQNSHR